MSPSSMRLSSTIRLGAGALLLAACAVASAQSTVGVGVQIGNGSAAGDEAVNAGDAPATHPFCLRSTGTRIAPKARTVDTDGDGKPDRVECVAANGRVYTRSDLETTGAVDIADALRRLDPSIR